MTLDQYLLQTSVFTLQEYLQACGDTQSNRNLLSRAVKTGKVLRVRAAVYASAYGKFTDHQHNPYQIAQKAFSDTIFCYDSAFKLFVGQHNVVNRIIVYSSSPKPPFEFQGIEYLSLSMPKTKPSTEVYTLTDGLTVAGTTKEQTLVDSLTYTKYALGVENVLRSISSIRYIDLKTLLEIITTSSKATRAKLGWVLERRASDWRIPETTLDGLAENLGSGPYYFSNDHSYTEGAWSKKWRLYFPEPLSTITTWING